MSKRNKQPKSPVVNECLKSPAQKYTVAAQAWDQINAEKRQKCVEQVKALILVDEELRLKRKKVQELIRKVNTTDEPATFDELDTLGAALPCSAYSS